MERVGIRGLRNDVAAIIRRAGGGERIIVTVDGEPIAQLGPLEATGAPTIDDLAAAGLVRLPGRADHPAPPQPFGVPIDVRLASVIAELRGEAG
jgi:antitoxin (DNA-binding transcriptional repressor) of toxin-antitoxin stability system